MKHTFDQDNGAARLLLAAAALLPGLQLAQAQALPEQATLSLQYMDYREAQPDLERIHAHTPSVALSLPMGGAWLLDGALTVDQLSGASPRHHTLVSGASRMSDNRHAAELSLTRYFARASAGMGAAFSNEHDYLSRALSLHGSVSSADQNASWSGGVAVSNDLINPVNGLVHDAGKHTLTLTLGLTQVLGVADIAQASLEHARGRGYFSDPYKTLDQRPAQRDQSSLTLRWNHHLASAGATVRSSYRYYRDSYGIAAHTLGGELVRPLAHGWQVTPSLRWHTQRAASFYYDPVYDSTLGAPFPPGYVVGGQNGPVSGDQRLAAFGARTLGLQVSKQLSAAWTLELKAERYVQRSGWRVFGHGSDGLAQLSARLLQVGLRTQW